MRITKQIRRDAKQLYRSCCVEGVLREDRARQVVGKLLELKPRGFQGILSHFQRLVQLDVARRTAVVESATPLPDPLRDAVKSNLGRLYGAGLMISFREAPTLLGGMRIKVGSDVYDGSVQARLARLEESF